MKHFWHLIKWDIVLLHRNKLFMLSLLLAAIYVGAFYLLKPLGNLNFILIALIFNDPVITGFMFGAVLLLFDKSQNTLEAILVLPFETEIYLLSKMLVLSTLATVVALVMTIVAKGYDFKLIPLITATFLSTFIFSALGFWVASFSKNFNQLLIYSIPLLLLSGIPLLAIWGFGTPAYFIAFPSTGGIALLQSAFIERSRLFQDFLMYAHLMSWALVSWLITVNVTIKRLT